MTAPKPDELYYRRVLFRTKLLGDRLYTPSHFWVQHQAGNVWRAGLTKFASRMLGDVVEIAFEVQPGAQIVLGDGIGSFEGFKALSELYSVGSGTFAGSNPLLIDRIAVVDDDRYNRGWLYEFEGTPDPGAMGMQRYAALLDETIDRMRASQREEAEG